MTVQQMIDKLKELDPKMKILHGDSEDLGEEITPKFKRAPWVDEEGNVSTRIFIHGVGENNS